MRSHGTLTKWNDDRGFGFITPAKASADLFVHISAFPKDGVRPRLNELVSFEIETGRDGKPRAVRIMRPAQKAAVPVATPRAAHRPNGLGIRQVLPVLVVGGLGVYAWSQFSAPTPASQAVAVEAAAPLPMPAPARVYSCDGRTMCTQMTSCEEATFFIRSCPGTKMDGDGDGVPCEDQWCN